MTADAIFSPWGAMAGGLQSAFPIAGAMAQDTSERDTLLVERCLNGDGGAWEFLVRSHTGLVYSTCYRFTSHADEARDLTQEVFLRLFRSLHTYDSGAGGFRTWLIRLTRNLLIDHYRKNRKHQVLDPLEDQIPAIEAKGGMGAQADYALRGREAGELLQSALRRLTPDLREAVILRDLQELEYKEIADVLRIPEGTVKSRINRGRAELARQLRALGVRG
jgi:RNA polymerase sigma-70 factor (ECF subfamily)